MKRLGGILEGVGWLIGIFLAGVLLGGAWRIFAAGWNLWQ